MNSKVTFLIIIFCTVVFTGKTCSQSLSSDNPVPFFSFDPGKIQFSSTLGPEINIDEQSAPKTGAIVAGTVMVTGGAVLAAIGQYAGKKNYDRYKYSAFTVNTDRFRSKVTQYNVMRIGGGVLAGTGMLVIVLSF